MNVLSPDLRLPVRQGPLEYTLGSEADHESVYQTLLHIFQGPERDEFLGSLLDPTYRPDQRVLVKVDGRLVSHVCLSERGMRFASQVVTLQGVMWIGTLPEYRGHGFAQNLLRLASGRARQKSVLLQTATTSMPQFFLPLGWAICGRHSIGLLASRNLPSGGEGPGDSRSGLWHVRPWRQVELGALMSLYDRQFGSVNGSIVRTEEYWRWLIGRRMAHVTWVVCRGESVLGYAFVKDHRILEIATDPEHPYALEALLGRVRSEAIERAYPEVMIHAPLSHPVMQVAQEAGGRIVDQEEWDGDYFLYNIPDPGRMLSVLLPEFARRARAARATLPVELGIVIGDQRWLLRIAQSRSSKVEHDRVGRRHLNLTPAGFTRLALGHATIDSVIEDELAEPSASTAIDAARLLFPAVPLWRSPLDSVTA